MILLKNIRRLVFLAFVFTVSGMATAQRWPGGIHDPSSIVKCDDTYWVFGTGDGIYSMYSTDLITWRPGPTPFTKTEFPAWIKTYVGAFEGTFWAPDIIFMNNKYYLYYSCSEWGTMTSVIGCVTNKTLNPADPEYKWEDAGFLGIWSYQPGLALNAIDPSLMRGPDGKIWMVYGSFNEQGIVVTEIDSVSGKPKNYAGNLPGTSIANSWTGPQSYNYGEGEGASMIYRNGFYYLFYNKGGCCAGIASTYYIVMGRSTSPRGPFTDKTGKALRIEGRPSGGTVVLRHDNSRGLDDRYFGPGHFGLFRENGVDYVTFHYYDPNGYYPNPAANNQGGPTLGLAKLVWGEDGWPSVSLDFVEEGVYTIENVYSGKVVDAFSHNPSEGAALFQLEPDSALLSQKWFFKSLGGGEYALKNYLNPGIHIETISGGSQASLALNSNYTGSVNQRFRTVTSPQGKTIIYPSVMDVAWGLSLPTSSDVKIVLKSVTLQDYLRWNMIPFDEQFSVSAKQVTVEHAAGVDKSIVVSCNGLWNASVFNPSWLNVEAPGVESDTLKIIFTENENAAERKNRIYVTTHGGKSEIITVTQAGKPSGTPLNETGTGIAVYPNPAAGELFIQSANQGKFTLFSISGLVMKKMDLTPGENKIDIRKLNPGIYLLRIDARNKTFVRKVQKL